VTNFINADGDFVEKQGDVYPVADGYTGNLKEDWYIRVSSYDGIISTSYVDHEPSDKEIFAAIVKSGGEFAEKIKAYSAEYIEV
jgi:poly-beta-hydroxyalkanoate depolymerase